MSESGKRLLRAAQSAVNASDPQYQLARVSRYMGTVGVSQSAQDVADEAIKRLESLTWQSIETAPKDGTHILVYLNVASVPVVHIAWFRSHEEWEASGQFLGDDTVEEWLGWWSYTRGSVTQEKLDGYREPRFWMPLPATPKESSDG